LYTHPQKTEAVVVVLDQAMADSRVNNVFGYVFAYSSVANTFDLFAILVLVLDFNGYPGFQRSNLIKEHLLSCI
jgi:hypothetical protein